MEFNKIVSPSLKQLFVEQLQDMILSEKLPLGSKLPPERELAEKMHVSRAVVNGGIAQLAKEGFIEVRPRQGNFVADYRRTGNIDTLTAIMEYRGSALGRNEIRSILEVRWGLEHLATRKAIESASDEDIEGLGQLLSALEKTKTPEAAAEAAFAYQHKLAFIGGNSVLPLLYYSFKTAVITLWIRFCSLYGNATLYRNTRCLYEFIKKRDLKGAENWIDTYLQEAIEGNRQIYKDK